MWNATSSKIRNPIAVWNNTVFSYHGVSSFPAKICCFAPCGCAAVYSLDLVTGNSSAIIISPANGDLRRARRIVAQPTRLLFLGGYDVQSMQSSSYVKTVFALTLSNGELDETGTWSQIWHSSWAGAKPIWESTAATVVGYRFLFFGGRRSDSAPFEVGLHAFDMNPNWSMVRNTPYKWYSRGANDNGGISGAAPGPREVSTMATDGQLIFVYGGYTYSKSDECNSDYVTNNHYGQLLSDFWMFEAGNNEWTNLSPYQSNVGPGPKFRHQHGMVCIGDRLFVFGGIASLAASPDLTAGCWDNCARDTTAAVNSLHSFNLWGVQSKYSVRYDAMLR